MLISIAEVHAYSAAQVKNASPGMPGFAYMLTGQNGIVLQKLQAQERLLEVLTQKHAHKDEEADALSQPLCAYFVYQVSHDCRARSQIQGRHRNKEATLMCYRLHVLGQCTPLQTIFPLALCKKSSERLLRVFIRRDRLETYAEVLTMKRANSKESHLLPYV